MLFKKERFEVVTKRTEKVFRKDYDEIEYIKFFDTETKREFEFGIWDSIFQNRTKISMYTIIDSVEMAVQPIVYKFSFSQTFQPEMLNKAIVTLCENMMLDYLNGSNEEFQVWKTVEAVDEDIYNERAPWNWMELIKKDIQDLPSEILNEKSYWEPRKSNLIQKVIKYITSRDICDIICFLAGLDLVVTLIAMIVGLTTGSTIAMTISCIALCIVLVPFTIGLIIYVILGLYFLTEEYSRW